MSAYNLLSGCGYDRRVQWAALIYLSTQFLLFMDFYIKSYTSTATKKKQRKQEEEKGGETSAVLQNGKPAVGRSVYEKGAGLRGREGARLRSSAK